MCDSDREPLFKRAGYVMSSIGIAHMELSEPSLDDTYGKIGVPQFAGGIREVFSEVLILSSDYDCAQAQRQVDAGLADAIPLAVPSLQTLICLVGQRGSFRW